MDTIEKLHEEIRSCTKCRLASVRNKAVPCRGNSKAKLLIVGESPGGVEDQTGVAFVGPAGQKLDTLAGQAGIDTDVDSFLTNVICCQPPGNEFPGGDVAKKCVSFLHRHVQILQPEVVVLLGKNARIWTVWRGIAHQTTEVAGKFFVCKDLWPSVRGVIPLVHPSYLLRVDRKDLEEEFVLGFGKAKTLLEEKEFSPDYPDLNPSYEKHFEESTLF